jgi:HAD superfamily hydrolase (TIGR01509 family)
LITNSDFPFQSVFFDMDGTLVDTEPYWLESETELMKRFGYEWTSFDQQQCLGGPLPRVGRYMQEKAGAENAEFFERELITLVAQKFSGTLSFMPGARELLSEIVDAGIPVGLVSASPRILVDSVLQNIGNDLFAITISSNDVVKSKPDPDPYLLAAEGLGSDISRSLILEDSLTGISAAQASGAWVLAIPHIVQVDSHPRTVITDTLVDSTLRELTSLFTERMAR